MLAIYYDIIMQFHRIFWFSARVSLQELQDWFWLENNYILIPSDKVVRELAAIIYFTPAR